MNESASRFVPILIIKSGVVNLDFYQQAFGAIELRRWSSDDGSIHVAELTIDGAMFHFHEESPEKGIFCPERHGGVTTTIGLMVPDVDSVMASALAAGATLASPATDYDYGYRQGIVIDPLGHRWMIEKKIRSL